MNSFKTIDGRGVNVHIANGACITIQFITNVIIHGLHIHDCKPTGNAMVRSSPTHYGWRTMADGDGISIFGSSHIWIDHNSLSNCADGLIDAIMGSTAITISNNYFTHHNEVRSTIFFFFNFKDFMICNWEKLFFNVSANGICWLVLNYAGYAFGSQWFICERQADASDHCLQPFWGGSYPKNAKVSLFMEPFFLKLDIEWAKGLALFFLELFPCPCPSQ